MNKLNLMAITTAVLLAGTALVGCNDTGVSNAEQQTTAVDDHAGHNHAEGEHGEESNAGHDHSGWWCVEHGVPEEECALCDTSLVAGFKAKGDWCLEHNRPESQCFICDASRFEPFAARYEAKNGEQPPKPTE